MTNRRSRLRRVGAGLAAVLLALMIWSPALTPAYAADDAKLVLVLDSSGSMKEKVGGDTKIAIAKSALNVVVDKLPVNAQVGLRVYGATVFDRSDTGACTDSQLVVPIGTDNRAALRREIATYKPYGETPISYSLKQAAKDLGENGARTIVLVSDGEETCDVDPCVTAANLAKQGINLKIDVIGLRVNAKARAQLQCVADRGNGTYYDADNKQQIEESLDKLATRAYRPFRLTGTPIEGSTDRDSPTPALPGQYVDQFGKLSQPLYYRVPRTMPGSTLRASFTSRPDAVVPTAFIRFSDADGHECGNGLGQTINLAGTRPLLTGQTSSWRSEDSSSCNTEPELELEVTSAIAEITGQKFELLVTEEAPVATIRGLPPAAKSISWQKMKPTSAAKPPVPGTSISDAPHLSPGTYRNTILTGETQVFAVNADWGQRVQAEVTVGPRRGALARELGIGDVLDLELLSPMRGRYRDLSVQGEPESDSQFRLPTQTFRQAATTPTITYLNRTGFSSQLYGSTPGRQYVVLGMNRFDKDKNFLVPYTLTVKVVGTAGEGAPTYVGQTSPSPTPSPVPTAEPGSTEPVPPPARGGFSLPAVISIAGGAVALGVGGTVAASLLRRRRRRTS